MRNSPVRFIIAVLSLFVFSSIALSQGGGAAKSSESFDPHDLNGIWGGGADPWPQDEALPMLPAAAAKYKSEKTAFSKPPVDGAENTDPLFKCEPGSVPRDYFVGHPIQIVQTPNLTLMLLEVYRNFRIIYTDGRKMPDHPEGTWFGDSIGHWEGNTFVVDTANFNDRTWLDKAGHPHSDQMKMTERFTRTDATHLKMDLTINDPGDYSAPFTGSKTFVLRPKSWIIEDYLCSPHDEQVMYQQVRDVADPAK